MSEGKNKAREILDNLLGFKPMRIIWDVIYSAVFLGLVYFIVLGLRSQRIEGYFEYTMFAVVLVFCFRELLKYFSDLPRLFLIPIGGIVLHFGLLIEGYLLTAFFEISIIIFVFLFISSIIYRVGFRKYLTKEAEFIKSKK